MEHIPIHLLQDRTNQGLQIKYFEKDEINEDPSVLGAHRDDHYIFFVLEEGMGSMVMDFVEVELSGRLLYYVLPGQVHYRIKSDFASGWYLAVDTALVPQACRNVFEGQLLVQQPYHLALSELGQCTALLSLLREKFNGDDANPFYDHCPVTFTIFHRFRGWILHPIHRRQHQGFKTCSNQ